MNQDSSRSDYDLAKQSDKTEKVMQKPTEFDLWEMEDDGIQSLPAAQFNPERLNIEEQNDAGAFIPKTFTPNSLSSDDEYGPEITEHTKIRRRKKEPFNILKVPLSPAEKLGVSVLAFLLLVAAALSVWYFMANIPTQNIIVKPLQFPQGGGQVRVTDAKTFWRAPILSGEKVDTVRRGVSVIPVIEMAFETQAAVIKAFFKDGDGNLVGDVITRNIEGNSKISIAATAGMIDEGMHTAYRTKREAPWKVEIFESTNRAARRDEFKKVFEMEISTEYR